MWDAQLYPHQYLHQPIWAAPVWPVRTLPFGSIKLSRFGVLNYMRMDQSGPEVETSVYISQFPWGLESAFFTKDHYSLVGAETSKVSHWAELSRAEQTSMGQSRLEQNGADQCRAKQTSEEQRYLAGEGPGPGTAWPRGRLTAVLFLQPCSKLSCFALNKVSFFTTPQIEDGVGIELGIELRICVSIELASVLCWQ